LAVTLQWLAWLGLPLVVPDSMLYGVLGGVLGGGLVVVLWWLFFSRAPWSERIGALVFLPLALWGTKYLVHESIANGAMGMLPILLGIPVLCLALVVWAVACHRLAPGPRRAALVGITFLACGSLMLLRTGGISGGGDLDLHWRWTPTPEERLLAMSGPEPAAPPPVLPAENLKAAWPGFRGPERAGIVRGVKIATDWTQTPPVQLWRRPVGPGWSSFAVWGEYFYTQEQRGPDEVVACYALKNGQPVWSHRDPVRFWESNAGAGPRATPTLSNGQVITLGATGLVNVLEATTGKVIWSHNAAADTGAKLPEWGFAGSPLVVADMVIVATAGRLVAYDRATGTLRWKTSTGGAGYSSPHLVTLDGVQQILLLNTAGITSVTPDTGKELWKYPWRGDGIVQPSLTAEGDLLLGAGSGLAGEKGVRCLKVTQQAGEWTLQERWSSTGLKPYFNDFVLHQGHAYGFDGSLLACIDLADGQRKWKGGRYGYGQLLLLADQDLLLVLSEQGGLALVAAKPDQYKELARHRAIEGKTWNHPVLVGDILLVRNSEEMAAFRLPH
jgi:outer membrane protein assembly factor BamB